MLQYQYQVASSGVQGAILGVIGAFVRLSREKYRYPKWFHGAHLRLSFSRRCYPCATPCVSDISAISRHVACRTMYRHVTPHAFAIPKSL